MSSANERPIMTPSDQDVFDRELADFIPERVFDAHAHMTHPKFFTFDCDGTLPNSLDVEGFRRYSGILHPKRQLGGLFLIYVDPDGDATLRIRSQTADQVTTQRRGANPIDAFANQWCAERIRGEPNCRGLMFVAPTEEPDFVRQEVQRLGLHGFKVYHNRVPQMPTFEADIPQYLPPWLVEIAHEQELAITLHMVKSRGVADPSNIHWIRHYCQTYPKMKLILAHSARGFQPQHNLEGLPQLRGLENLYFDSSANCSALAHQVIIRTFGHGKLMYGSDFPISHIRGTNFGAGDSFIWIDPASSQWNQPKGRIEPLLIGIEHLRSVKYACWSERLSDRQVEDIFWNNAAELFGLP